MSTSKDEPNPLRPYYVPPSVGRSPNLTSKDSHSPKLSGNYGSSQQPTSPSFGSSARNILADMDYSEYLSETSPSSSQTVKKIAERAIWKYASVFLAQPFEVAKVVLQVRAPNTGLKGSFQTAQADEGRRKPFRSRGNDAHHDLELPRLSKKHHPASLEREDGRVLRITGLPQTLLYHILHLDLPDLRPIALT
ncbi:MAG: hypothetical protein Q9220_005758 [cf. Caloplaca sp. 1 TL-2023]